ncbi:uncharacterized protein LOC124316732 [Daphnia pulicaria]|uniref:uncharacterized protein LOC124316732 n=1 Tax=Daphnia pulicaria TaxID=35523 RepID=UPI001EEC9757|nr:uncharacterized protein LOC124316732 [Daphnia pulicaria]
MIRYKCVKFIPYRHLASFWLLATWLSLVLTVVFLHQFLTIAKSNIILIKHQQGEKPSAAIPSIDLRVINKEVQSTSSRAADRRGPHQKVISYSIYGNFSLTDVVHKYLRPFKETIKIIPLIYPGWIVRIYHNLTKDETETWKFLKNTLDLGAGHVDLCNATDIIEKRKLADLFAMTWRWLPLLDDMVDTLMSRDSDSNIIPREKDAVREWLDSNKTFHIMRDHPAHCRFIVGCCWGVKISQDRSSIVNASKKMFTENHLHEYDYDQKLLDKLIWPIAITNMVVHDSYCCEKIPFSHHPFPTQRRDMLFIGIRGKPEEELKFPCPPKCRPANATSKWSFC